MLRATRTAVLLAMACLPWEGLADERFDHRGAVGLLLGGGGEYMTAGGEELQSGPRGLLDLGGTVAVGVDGNELMLLGRAALGGPQLEGSVNFGYRGYFGQERFKTFFQLGAALYLQQSLSAGPRVGFGAQWELSPLVGLYAGLAASVSFGQVVRFGAEGYAGLQLRSYLLE